MNNLFHSARLKLTAYYFAVIVVLCLLLTFGVRAFTNYEITRSDSAQRGAVHQLLERWYGQDSDPNTNGNTAAPPGDDRYFVNAQAHQSTMTRDRLNRDFFLMDLLLLVSGAVVSYWYAGRTLKPIEDAHEQQKRFTSDASHELRTPLTAMKLENEVFLRQKSFTEPEARDLIASNLEEVERLERLASNLLSLSRYENDAVVKQPVAMQQVVEEALKRVKQRLPKTVKPVFTTKIAPAVVLADFESLAELLTILLDNAVKYGPTDGEIVFGGEKRGNAYVLAVRDHGKGIAAEDMPHIFERMYRGDKARSKVSGHGIGLSLARQIADANGAKLEAANHPKGGAMFIVTLT